MLSPASLLVLVGLASLAAGAPTDAAASPDAGCPAGTGECGAGDVVDLMQRASSIQNRPLPGPGAGTPSIASSLMLFGKAVNELGAVTPRAQAQAHSRALSFDATKIAQILNLVLAGTSDAVEQFTKEPPAIVAGSVLIANKVWDILDITLPENIKDSAEYKQAKDAFDMIIAALGQHSGSSLLAVPMPKFVEDFKKYAETAKPEHLISGINDLITTAKGLVAEPFPESVKYLDAALTLVEGAGSSWEAFADGKAVDGIKGLYNSLKSSADSLLSPELKNDETYKLITGVLDATLGKLDKLVLRFEEAMANRELCYWKTIDRPQEKKSWCQPGYEYDNAGWCHAGPFKGGACYRHCGDGRCPSWCGEGYACCKQGDNTYADCDGATGFFIRNSDYKQCAKMPQNSALEVQASSGEVVEERQALQQRQDRRGVASKEALDNVLANKPDKKTTTAKPTTPAPNDGRPKPVAAACEPGSGQREEGNYCVSGCPANYIDKGGKCQQTCYGETPVQRGAMCGIHKGALDAWMTEVVLAGIQKGALIVFKIKDAIEKKQATAKDLVEVIDALVDIASKFTLRTCDDTGGE